MPLLTNETLWLYCSVDDHCQKGMSMSIVVGNNPSADDTLEKYQAAAAKVAVASAPTTTIGGTLVLPSATGAASGSASASDSVSASSSAYATGIASGNSTATTTALSTTITSKGSTVTATKSGSGSGSASATSSGAAVTASGAAGQAKVPVALGFAGIAGGLAAFMI